MATVTLGSVPQMLKVILTKNADFVASMKKADNTSWPSAQLFLQFEIKDASPIVWQASFSGAVASWNVDLVDVNALLAAKPRGVKLWYDEGDYEALWAQGEIDVRGT